MGNPLGIHYGKGWTFLKLKRAALRPSFSEEKPTYRPF